MKRLIEGKNGKQFDFDKLLDAAKKNLSLTDEEFEALLIGFQKFRKKMISGDSEWAVQIFQIAGNSIDGNSLRMSVNGSPVEVVSWSLGVEPIGGQQVNVMTMKIPVKNIRIEHVEVENREIMIQVLQEMAFSEIREEFGFNVKQYIENRQAG